MSKRNQLIAQANAIQEKRRNLRQREESLRSRTDFMRNQPLVSSDLNVLRSNLAKIIPKHLMPHNIGRYHEVMWPFWFTLDFDFGTDPTYNSNTRQKQSIQVSQDSAFLLTGITRTHFDRGAAGQEAPLQLTIRDNQSTRQFNDKPIPMQAIGNEAEYTRVPTPLFIAPNASVSIELTSWSPGNHATVGNGFHQFVLSGWRIRTEDAGKVLASIFI